MECGPFGQPGVADEFQLIRLENPGWAPYKPGQFVMIRPDSFGLELPWGRPFSICRADSESVSIFFQVVGRGTGRIAALNAGDEVAMWGPLGNSFAVSEDKKTLILAGGMGIAPFFGYLEAHPDPDRVEFFFAHRMPLYCYPYDFLAMGVDSDSCQEQSPEDIDAIVSHMADKVAELDEDDLVLACGPEPFLKSVRDICSMVGIRVQVSLENRMACGVGACLGCVCESKGGWPVQVCTQGPVFWADEIRFTGDE